MLNAKGNLAGFLLMLAFPPAWCANHTVIVGAGGMLVFSPSTLNISVGDSVTFTNVGGFHNVVADDHSFRCANGCDGMGGSGSPNGSFWSAMVTFNSAGTIGYYCEAHGSAGSGMFGTIVVQGTPVELQRFDVE